MPPLLADPLQVSPELLEWAQAIAVDPAGRILFWSRGAAALYGWPAAQTVGRNLHELLHTQFPGELRQAWESLSATGSWEGELQRVRNNGTPVTVASRWLLQRDPAGQPAAVLEIGHDVTPLKQVRLSLEDFERRREAFLATLAHELRNPLAPIRNALHLLRLTENRPATLMQAREIMDRQVGHMVRLLDDLLVLSRLTRGKIDLRKEVVDIRTVIQLAVEASRPALDAGAQTFVARLPDEPVLVEVDSVRLAHALASLLNNAAKYTAQEGRIELSVDKPAGGRLRIQVRDTGLGIPADMLPQVFDMFSNVDRILNRGQGGLGIGLSLARGLVRLHGGEVEAHSAGVGQGSEFTIVLPCQTSGSQARAPKKQGERHA